MSKAKDQPSPLVVAAAALGDELRGFADLASEAKRESLNTERSMSRATRSLSESVQFHARIEGKLKALVAEIESARKVQQESVETLVGVAHEVERRAKSRDALLARFEQLGSQARQTSSLALESTTLQKEAAAHEQLLERLGAIERQIDEIVSEARAIAQAAASEDWPEIGRQADGLGQQMQAAKNKLVLAHQGVARRAPS